MNVYLLIRDHLMIPGAIEVAWRTEMSFETHGNTDFVWGVFSNEVEFAWWARSRKWRNETPDGVIDLRREFSYTLDSIPELAHVEYYRYKYKPSPISDAMPNDVADIYSNSVANAGPFLMVAGNLNGRIFTTAINSAGAGHAGSLKDRLRAQVLDMERKMRANLNDAEERGG